MYSKNLPLIFFLILFSTVCFTQDLTYYKPVGFHNPPLKSGQFISSFSYYHSSTESIWDTKEMNYSDQSNSDMYLDLIGYLGLTDDLTLQTNLRLFPKQKIYEIIKRGSGSDENGFNIQPSFQLSYRIENNFELFGNLSYFNFERLFGDRTSYRTIPIGVDPNTGETIYIQAPVTMEGNPDLNIKGYNFRIGMSYIGDLW